MGEGMHGMRTIALVAIVAVRVGDAVRAPADEDAWRSDKLCSVPAGGPTTSAVRTTVPPTRSVSLVAGVARVQTELVARDSSGRPRVSGGDSFAMRLVSGPERVHAEVRDMCNGTYTIAVDLAVPGTYVWGAFLEWTGNHGLDERLDPVGRLKSLNAPLGCADAQNGRRRAAGKTGKKKCQGRLIVTVRPPAAGSTPAAWPPCPGWNHPGRYRGLPAVVGAHGAHVTLDAAQKQFLWGVDPRNALKVSWADRWTPTGCTYPAFPGQGVVRRALRGKTIVVAGDSEIRIFFINFLQIALGVHIAGCTTPNPRACLCHGAFEVRLDVKLPGNKTILYCHDSLDALQAEMAKNDTRIAAPPHADEVLLLFLFAPLTDCKAYLEHESSSLFDMSACVKSSGNLPAQESLLEQLAARADVVLFDIGAHPISGDRRGTQARAPSRPYRRDRVRRGGQTRGRLCPLGKG
jgi:hypothetical protein